MSASFDGLTRDQRGSTLANTCFYYTRKRKLSNTGSLKLGRFRFEKQYKKDFAQGSLIRLYLGKDKTMRGYSIFKYNQVREKNNTLALFLFERQNKNSFAPGNLQLAGARRKPWPNIYYSTIKKRLDNTQRLLLLEGIGLCGGVHNPSTPEDSIQARPEFSFYCCFPVFFCCSQTAWENLKRKNALQGVALGFAFTHTVFGRSLLPLWGGVVAMVATNSGSYYRPMVENIYPPSVR